MIQKSTTFCLALLLTITWLFYMILGLNQTLAAEKIPLKVATVCMNAEEDKDANIQTFFSYMEEAAAQGAHLVVFPEFALQQNPCAGSFGYIPTQNELDYLRSAAETIPGDSTQMIADKARELNIYVVFGMTEYSPNDDKLYNSNVFLGPDGVIGKYHKINLWDTSGGGNEHLYHERGNEFGVFDSPIGKLGLATCFDMTQNINVMLASKGADLLVTVAAWLSSYSNLYEQLTTRSASQTKLWHIVSNQYGKVGHTENYGHSRIIDPNGNIIADTGQKDGMVIAEIGLLIDPPIVNIPTVEDTTDVKLSLGISTMWGKLKKLDL